MPDINPGALIAAGPQTTSNVGSINDQMPEKITPSPEGDKVVNLDAFDDVKSGQKIAENVATKTDPKVDEALKVEEEKNLKAFEEKQRIAKEQEENKEKETPTTPVKPPPTARTTPPKVEGLKDEDFKDLVPETAIPLLKKASKETQEFILAELRRNKTALEAAKAEVETTKKSVREGLPTSWYEHEHAYTLTPEFQSAQTKASTLRNYADHFRQQLINIKDGEKWIDLVVGADGKPRQEVREPGSAAEVSVLERIQRFEHAFNQEQTAAANIAHTFKQQVGALRGDMKKAEDEYFPQYKEGFDKNEHGQYVLKMLASRGMGHVPTNSFLAKLYATFIEVNNELETLRAEKDKGKKIAAVNNGPTGEDINRGTVEEKVKSIEDTPFNPDAFEAVIQRMR